MFYTLLKHLNLFLFKVIDLQRTKTPEPAKSDERAKINGGDDYDDYVITDDQRLALIELQKMKDDMDDYPGKPGTGSST